MEKVPGFSKEQLETIEREEKIVATLEELYRINGDDLERMTALQNDITDYVEKVEAEYPTARQYALFHPFVASSEPVSI